MNPHPPQDNFYRITRWDLEEYYDAIAHINGKPDADRMWERIERNTRSRPHTPAPAATHFIIDAGLRADVAETLRMAGCPSLACRVLDDTMPDYQINAEREKVLQDLLYNIDSETGFYVFPHPKSNAGNGLSRFVLLDDMTTLVESLQSTQQQAGDQYE